MKILRTLLVSTLILAFALPAFAGEGHGKCTASTQECLNGMAAHYSKTGWAGLDGKFDKETGEYLVTSVVWDSPGATAGIEKGDRILGMNGHVFAKMDEEEWASTKAERVPGKTITYMAKRGDKKQKFELTLVEMPEELIAEKVGHHLLEHATMASVQ